MKKTPCPVLDPVEIPYIPPDPYGRFSLRIVGPFGVVRKEFSKDPSKYCPRCQTDHIQYTAIQPMKPSCCEELIQVAGYFLVGPTGPIHMRCAKDHEVEGAG